MGWKRALIGGVGSCLVALAAPAFAHTIVYTGTFSAEVSGGTGTGSTTVTIDNDLFTMRVQADFSGLSGTVTQAHIHCCTTAPGTGNAGVATILPSFTNFPTGVTSGTYDFTYDLTNPANFGSGFLSANGGTAGGAFAALITGLDDRRAYFNIHTSTFGGGEIRAVLAAPEPTASALLWVALGLVARRMRSRPIA